MTRQDCNEDTLMDDLGKSIKKRHKLCHQPVKGTIMVKHPATGVIMTKAEYERATTRKGN